MLTLEEQAKRAYEQFLAHSEQVAAEHHAKRSGKAKYGSVLPSVDRSHQRDAARYLHADGWGSDPNYSLEYHSPDGVYLSIDDIDGMEETFANIDAKPTRTISI